MSNKKRNTENRENPKETIEQAKKVLDTYAREEHPTEEQVEAQKSMWERTYGDHEQKKASQCLEVDAQEIDRETFHRFPALERQAQAYGYELDEIRVFSLGRGVYKVTDLEGRDIDRPKMAQDTWAEPSLPDEDYTEFSDYVTTLDHSDFEGETLETVKKVVVTLENVVELLDKINKGLHTPPVVNITNMIAEPKQRFTTPFTTPFVKPEPIKHPWSSNMALYGDKQTEQQSELVEKSQRSGLALDEVVEAEKDKDYISIDGVIQELTIEEDDEDEDEAQEDYIRQLTDEQIVRKYVNGESIVAIMDALGISTGRVYTTLRKNNIALKSSGHREAKGGLRAKALRENPEEGGKLIRDYREGMSNDEIMEKYKITQGGLFSVLDTYNVPRKRQK